MTSGPEAWAKASFISVRLAVPAAAPPARAHSRKLRREIFLAMMFSSLDAKQLTGQAQIAMHDRGLRFQFLRSAGIDHGALFHKEHPRTELEGGLYVLFHQQDRNPALVAVSYTHLTLPTIYSV